MRKIILLDNHPIGPDFPPYIVAEMSANHNGSYENACKIIKAAKHAGADAVKIQTYKPDTITLHSDLPDFQITEGLWAGKTLYELYELAHTPWEWHSSLFQFARKIGITIFSSPFDTTAVDLLEDLNVPAYKIASFEAVDLQLIKYVASTKKPLIISTGMADEVEIEEAVEAAHEGGCEELILLHCVSGYPAPASDYNLHTMSDMRNRYDLITGLSDHTIDSTTAITSIALGASVIEKHFTLDRKQGGPDDSFSVEPDELNELCRACKTAWEALGKVDYGRKSSERGNVKFRRSLYFVKEMEAGEIITEQCIRSVRPGFGMAPKNFQIIIGKIVNRNLPAFSPVKEEFLL